MEVILRDPLQSPLQEMGVRTGKPGVGGGSAPFTPDASFFAGRPGLAWDFATKSLLFQATDGTGAVVATDDPIRYATDLSGQGKHGTSVGTSASLYKDDDPRAVFDGIQNVMVSPNIDMTGTDKVTVVVSMTLLSDALSIPFEFSEDTYQTVGAFNVWRSYAGPGQISPGLRGTSYAQRDKYAIAAPVAGVFTFKFDLAGLTVAEQIHMSIGGVDASFDTGTGTAGGGNFGNHKFYLGSRYGNSLPANIAVKRIVVCGWELTPEELVLLGG